MIFNDSQLINNPNSAILNGFKAIENKFVNNKITKDQEFEKSGSCALVSLFLGKYFLTIIDNQCYIANIGDSRAILCDNAGNVFNLSSDHKPNNELEKERVINNNGNIFMYNIFNIRHVHQDKTAPPIYRTEPGALAVSRTIGDVEAKVKNLGGQPGVVSPIPDIIGFELRNDIDFIVMGSKVTFN